MEGRYRTYEEFWPFYVAQHRATSTRWLHFTGTTLVLCALVAGFVVAPLWFLAAPFFGYGFAWLGHFAFEHNRPATFTYPFYSFLGDWVMWKDMLAGRIKF